MIVFWVVAGALAAAAAGLVLHRAASAERGQAFDPARELYRRQLAEIDDLADRGLLADAERRSARAEAGRRLLRAADAPQAAWRADAGGRRALLAAAIAASAATLLIYAVAGAPGVADQPLAKRLAAWRAADPSVLTAPELAAVLARVVRERPGDVDALRFLAIAESASQEPAEAVRAARRAVRLAPQRADLWEMLGEARIAQAGGEVTSEAQAAFREALKRDPTRASARFHLARAQVEAGDKAGGIAAWRSLAADLAPADPRREMVLAAIAQAEGAPATPPQAAAGQMAMIQGMVRRLAERLAASPDDAEGWVRLVHAYAVLGEASKRDEALRAARVRYAAKPDVLARLDAAARAEPM